MLHSSAVRKAGSFSVERTALLVNEVMRMGILLLGAANAHFAAMSRLSDESWAYAGAGPRSHAAPAPDRSPGAAWVRSSPRLMDAGENGFPKKRAGGACL